jgi:hypothetical protein
MDTTRLQHALDTHRHLRDDNFVSPDSILVFTEATDTLEDVAVALLPLRYPLSGKGARWSQGDFERILAAKHLLYRQSLIADEISDEDPTAQPPMGTVCLVDSTDRHCLSWNRIQARVDPALN